MCPCGCLHLCVYNSPRIFIFVCMQNFISRPHNSWATWQLYLPSSPQFSTTDDLHARLPSDLAVWPPVTSEVSVCGLINCATSNLAESQRTFPNAKRKLTRTRTDTDGENLLRFIKIKAVNQELVVFIVVILLPLSDWFIFVWISSLDLTDGWRPRDPQMLVLTAVKWGLTQQGAYSTCHQPNR